MPSDFDRLPKAVQERLRPYLPVIEREAAKQGLPLAVPLSILEEESAGVTTAVGDKKLQNKAHGGWQVRDVPGDKNGYWLRGADPYDPVASTVAIMPQLKKLYSDDCGGDLECLHYKYMAGQNAAYSPQAVAERSKRYPHVATRLERVRNSYGTPAEAPAGDAAAQATPPVAAASAPVPYNEVAAMRPHGSTTNRLKYGSLGEAITAMQSQSDDKLKRLSAEQPPATGPVADVHQGSTQPTAPAPAPAKPQAAAGAEGSMADRIRSSRFVTQFLPTQKTVEGKPMTFDEFYALPFEQRSALANRYVDERSKAEAWPANDTAEARKQMDTLVYADTGGKAPGIGGRVFGDILDRAAASLRGNVKGAAAAAADKWVSHDTAEALRASEQHAQAADMADYGGATKDVLRRRALRKREEAANPEGTSWYDRAGGWLGDLARAPGAVAGEVAGSVLPALAVAATTRNLPLAARVLTGGSLIGVPAALNVNEASYQAGRESGKSHEQARAAADAPGATALQMLSGALETAGVGHGVEKLLRAGGGSALRRSAKATAGEAAEGAATSVPAQMSENIATGRPTFENVGAAAAEGALQEAVGGALLSPVVNLMATTLPGEQDAAQVGNPQQAGQQQRAGVDAQVQADGQDGIVQPIDAGTGPQAGSGDSVGQEAAVAEGADGVTPDGVEMVLTPVAREVPVPDMFDTPSQVMAFLDKGKTPQPTLDNIETTLSGLFARPQPVTLKELQDMGAVFTPGVVNEHVMAPAQPAHDPQRVREAYDTAVVAAQAAADARATETPAAQSQYNANPLARRDYSGVPDTPVSPELSQALLAPEGVASTSAVEHLTRTASTPAQRKMAGFLLDILKRAEFLLGSPISIFSQENLTVTGKDGKPQRASGVFQVSADATRAQIILDRESGLVEEVLLHEVTHAATEAHMTASPDKLSPLQKAARQDIEALHQYALDQGLLKTFEIPTASEFVAEALTNPRLQAAMKATPYSGKLSVWGKFKESLRGLLGMDKLKVPDNLLEATLTAVDALTVSGARFEATTAAAARQRREAPPLPPEMERQKILDQQVKEATDAAKADMVDFIQARFSNDPKDYHRGSAFYDRTAKVWHAKFLWDDGRVYENQAPLRSLREAEEFLNRFRPLDENGQPVADARAVVVKEGKNTGHVANFEAVNTVLDALRPGARTLYDKAVALGISKDVAHAIAKWTDGATRWNFSRLSALDAVKSHTGSLRENALIRRAKLANQTKVAGFNGERTMKTLLDNLYGSVEAAQKASPGVTADMTDMYMYAASAAQGNAIKAKKMPTDAFGRPRIDGKDFAKFSYYEAPNGSITVKGAPGARHVTGADAAIKYQAQFAKQFPEAAKAMTTALDHLREANKAAIAIQLENGAIGPQEAADLLAQDLYLPMQQIGKRTSGAVRSTIGRSTMATSPLAQLKGVLDARINYSAYKGAIQELALALQHNPNPAIGDLNSYDVKASTSPKVDEDTGEVDAKALISADWIGERSVKVWVGDRQLKLTINDDNLLKALKPTKHGDTPMAIVGAMAATTQAFSAMLTATLRFVLQAAGWDLAQINATMQAAYKNESAIDAYKQVLGTYKRMVPALGDSVRSIMKRDTKDPMRRFYDVNGGGIVFGAKNVMRDALLDAGKGSAVDYVQRGTGAVLNAISAPGHVVSDAVRFASFKAFMESKHGGPFKSEAELAMFADAHPDIVKQAVMGSKILLGNYEDVGQQLLLRSVVPFYNAASVGVGQNLYNAATTRQGQITMGVIATTAMITALAAMGDDDEDEDGFGKFLRKDSSWTGLNIGDTVVPLPHEMRLALMAGYWAAAGVNETMGHSKPQDYENLTRRSINAVVQGAFLPIPGIEAGDKEFFATLGPLGTLAMLAKTENDAFGRPRVSQQAEKKFKAELQPYYMNPRPSDTADAVEVSKLLFEVTGFNVSPAAADIWIGQFAGGWNGLRTALEKSRAEGRSDTDGFGEWVMGGYNQSEDNLFASTRRWDAERAEHMSAPEFRKQQFIEHNKAVKKATDGIGSLYTQMGQARRDGNVEMYRQLQEQIKQQGGGADKLRRDWYRATGNQNRNLLEQ